MSTYGLTDKLPGPDSDRDRNRKPWRVSKHRRAASSATAHDQEKKSAYHHRHHHYHDVGESHSHSYSYTHSNSYTHNNTNTNTNTNSSNNTTTTNNNNTTTTNNNNNDNTHRNSYNNSDDCRSNSGADAPTTSARESLIKDPLSYKALKTTKEPRSLKVPNAPKVPKSWKAPPRTLAGAAWFTDALPPPGSGRSRKKKSTQKDSAVAAAASGNNLVTSKKSLSDVETVKRNASDLDSEGFEGGDQSPLIATSLQHSFDLFSLSHSSSEKSNHDSDRKGIAKSKSFFSFRTSSEEAKSMRQVVADPQVIAKSKHKNVSLHQPPKSRKSSEKEKDKSKSKHRKTKSLFAEPSNDHFTGKSIQSNLYSVPNSGSSLDVYHSWASLKDQQQRRLKKPHHHPTQNGFLNPWNSHKKPLRRSTSLEVFTEKQNTEPSKYEVAAFMLLSGKPDFKQGAQETNSSDSKVAVTWIGHSTFVIQFNGFTILTDPAFTMGDAASDRGWKRIIPPGCKIKDLPRIDAVLISNDKVEHLDMSVVEYLKDVTWFVPLGISSALRAAGVTQVLELDWYQSVTADTMKFICAPSQHHSGSISTDTDDTLWCSWVLKSKSTSVFFAGATGYRFMASDRIDLAFRQGFPKCPEFRKIGKNLGPFLLAILPIGGSAPRVVASSTYCDALDAACIHLDLKAKHSVPCHWGTFYNFEENILDPIRQMEDALIEARISPNNFMAIYPGRTTIYS